MHIFITGASSGLGEALALHYARPGLRLTLTGRDPERLRAVAVTARMQGAAVQDSVMDVTDRDGMRALILSADDEQPIDLLIANAGLSHNFQDWERFDAEARSMFEVNLTGVMNSIHPLMPRMLARKRGQIALVASLAGLRGLASAPAYCASKAAVIAYGQGLRGALGRHGIKVNVICPGFVRTRMTARNRFPMPFLMDADQAARIMARGLARNKSCIAYPWRMHMLARAFAALPDFLIDRINRILPMK